MKAKRSPLSLHDTFLLQSHLEVSKPPETEDLDLDELFKTYEIDIDFGIKIQEEIDYLITKIGINMERKTSGYHMLIECISYLSVSENVDNQIRTSMIIENGLSLNINFARNYIASQTAHAPLGKYLLPSIDARDLIDKKFAHQKGASAKKSTKKKGDTK